MSPPDVSVVVPTRDRPAELADALTSLQALDNSLGLRVEVLVVDNDPAGGAEAVAARYSGGRFPVRYLQEPRPGVAHVRNTGVGASQAALVAFLDDDAIAAPGWLEALVGALRRYGADAVFGPKRIGFVGEPPAWDPRGEWWAGRNRLPAGVPAPYACTANALVRRVPWLEGPAPFDPAFGETGGEDGMLLVRMRRAGGRAVWCPQAEILERVPADRAELGYLLERYLRLGQTRTRHLLAAGELGAAARQAAHGLALGVPLGLVGALMPGRSRVGARARLQAAKYLGMAFFGGPFTVRPYASQEAGGARPTSASSRATSSS